MDKKLKEIQRIANNVLYFDDNSDFGSALYNILNICTDKENSFDDLEYVENE